MKKNKGFRPSWKERLQFVALGPLDVLLYLVCRSFRTFLECFSLLPPRYLAWSGRIRARREFYLACAKSPGRGACGADQTDTVANKKLK